MENVPCILVRDVVGAASSDDGSHILLQLATDLYDIKVVMPLGTSEDVVANLMGAAASTSRVGGTGKAKAVLVSVLADPETGRPSLLVETEDGPVSFDLGASALLSLAGSIARYAVEGKTETDLVKAA